MRPMCDASVGEDHHQAQCTQTMEPPTTMGPAPSSDEEIHSDPGHQEEWGQPLGKNNTTLSGYASRMSEA